MNSATVPTPLGPFSTVVDDDGAVLAAGWTAGPGELVPLIAKELRSPLVERAELGAVTDAVLAYHRGALDAVDDVPVRQRSGAFLEHAWEVLRKIPPGEPITYTAFAALAGRPGAVRAAGSACGRNAAALFVPCHRVLRTDGSLGGFRWGLELKRALLGHERSAHTGTARRA